MAVTYCNYGNGSSTGHYAVTAWAAATTKAAGAMVRQSATPSVGNERVFVCIVAGNTHATTEPTWTVTKGAKTTDNTITWQECTGQPAVNGDVTNTPNWTSIKNTAIALGRIIKNDAATHYFICSTAGTAGNGSEPSWGTTAGNTTADNTVTWTCLGAVGSFAAWGAPHARLANAVNSNWITGLDTVYIASASAETQAAAMSFGSWPAVSTGPVYIICVNAAGSVPPVSADVTTGATVTTTGNNALTLVGSAYIVGVQFNCASGAVSTGFPIANASGAFIRAVNCTFSMPGTSGGDMNFCNSSNNYVLLENCNINFAATGQRLIYKNKFIWRGGAVGGSAAPTSLVICGQGSGEVPDGLFEGVDLSALGSGKTLFSSVNAGYLCIKDCKLGASVTIAANPSQAGMGRCDVINSDSGNTNYRTERYEALGTLTTETTIVRSGGATDGTTPIAWKIVTTSGAQLARWQLPFESFPILIWNESTGSALTVDLYGVWGGGAVPNNDDIWIEAEYLGDSSFPTGSFANSTKANMLATSAAVSSDGSTWGGSTTAFKLSVSLTPQKKGLILLRVKAGAAGSTFYVDPRPSISGKAVSRSFMAPLAYASELRAATYLFGALPMLVG